MVFLKIICTHFIFTIILQTDHKPDGVQVGAYLKEITPSDFHQLQQSHKLIDLCCYGSTPGKEGLKNKTKKHYHSLGLVRYEADTTNENTV